MRPVSARTTALLLALILPACGTSTRVPVEWTATKDEIAIVATGPPEAVLVLFAGQPNGPNVIRTAPGIWATVGPGLRDSPPGTEVARVAFDASGVARATFPRQGGPPGGVLLQGTVFPKNEPFRPIGVTDCMSLRWDDEGITIRPHVADVIRSAVSWRLGIVAAIVAACVLLRFVPLRGASRRIGFVLLLAGAAVLVWGRIRAPDIHRTGGPDQPQPILVPPDIAPAEPSDPVDRMTFAGFHDLVTHARSLLPKDAPIDVVPSPGSPRTEHAAWQAAWMLWPHAARVREPGFDPFRRRGACLTFDEGPAKAGARVLWRNQAGCAWVVEEAEGR